MAFVINWDWDNSGRKCYVSKTHRSNHRPYTPTTEDAKTWCSKKNAERYLSLKDPGYASKCKIEEI